MNASNSPNSGRPLEFSWEVDNQGYEWQEARTLVDKQPNARESDYENPTSSFQVPDFSQMNKSPEWAIVPASKPQWGRQGQAPRWRTYSPLVEHPGMFRKFAMLNPHNRDDILSFANNYGLLGIIEPIFSYPPDPDLIAMTTEQGRVEILEYLSGLRRSDDVSAFCDIVERLKARSTPNAVPPLDVTDLGTWNGETHFTWGTSILQMRWCVALADYIQAHDLSGLGSVLKCLQRPGGGTHAQVWAWFLKFGADVPRVMMPAHEGVSPSKEDEELLEMLYQAYRPDWGLWLGDVGTVRPPASAAFRVAGDYISETVNDILHGRVQTELAFEPGTDRLALRMRPDNLLTAMWLQFSQAITGNKQFRQCRECGTWFEIGADDDARTARRLFCSDPCKSRDYRKRKDRAVALKAEGLTPSQVAEKLKTEGLETDPDTVKGWVGRKPRKKEE